MKFTIPPDELAYYMYSFHYRKGVNDNEWRQRFFNEHSKELAKFTDILTNHPIAPPLDAFGECFDIYPNGLPPTEQLEQFLNEWAANSSTAATTPEQSYKIPLPTLPTDEDARKVRNDGDPSTIGTTGTPLPEMPTFESTLWEEIKDWIFDVSKDYPAPFCLLEYNGTGFSRLRNIQAISGQKKHGKTFLVTILMAAILSIENKLLPGLRVPQRTLEHLGHNPTVLYCDTEMDEADRALVQRRVHYLCGWDFRIPNQRFNILSLTLCPREKRWDIIKKAIEYFKPDAVFIDGLRDLVTSINNEDMAVQITDEMMRVAAANKCCIWNALHENPNPGKKDDIDGKMRGWLGTELANKGSDTLVSVKDKDKNTLAVTFKVKQTDARGKDIEPFTFSINGELAGKIGIPQIIESTTTTATKATHTPEEVQKWLEAGKHEIEWPTYLTEIKAIFKKHGNVTNSNEQTECCTMAKNRRFILKQDKSEFETGQKSPKYRLNPELFPE